MTLKKDDVIIEVLKLIAPGTPIREGLENILKAKTGALIAIGDTKEILDLVDGGSYFTISTGSESIALSNIPLQYLVDTKKSGFFYGQSFLHNKYASRIRCIKIQVEE